MAGGPTSFTGENVHNGFGGQGGFGGTPIEEALPVRMVTDRDVVNVTTKVSAVDSRHAVAAGLDWSSCPALRGHNRVVAKPQATVVARTDSQDPFLVLWSYGKGRAAAVTTSSARKWGTDFKGWPQYNRFWANLIRWAKG